MDKTVEKRLENLQAKLSGLAVLVREDDKRLAELKSKLTKLSKLVRIV